jgi:sensor domain CHASE-containing protein
MGKDSLLSLEIKALVARQNTRMVILPLLGMILVSVAISMALLLALVGRIDRQSDAQVRQMIEGAIQTRSSALALMTRDYGRWDDAVSNLYGKLDREWAVANLSNATHVFVFDQAGKTHVSVGPDGSAGVDARQAMPTGLRVLLAQLPMTLAGARAIEAGVTITTRFNGFPTLVSAMPIIPYSDRIIMPNEPIRYVAITQALDGPLLSEWQKSFGLENVRITGSLPREEEAHAISIPAPHGEELGWISWDHVEPGRAAARSLLPYLLIGFALFVAACYLLSKRVLGVTKELAIQIAAADRAAAIAAANLEIARQAQIKAEAAQVRAEALATEATIARREASLKLASRSDSTWTQKSAGTSWEQ